MRTGVKGRVAARGGQRPRRRGRRGLAEGSRVPAGGGQRQAAPLSFGGPRQGPPSGTPPGPVFRGDSDAVPRRRDRPRPHGQHLRRRDGVGRLDLPALLPRPQLPRPPPGRAGGRRRPPRRAAGHLRRPLGPGGRPPLRRLPGNARRGTARPGERVHHGPGPPPHRRRLRRRRGAGHLGGEAPGPDPVRGRRHGRRLPPPRHRPGGQLRPPLESLLRRDPAAPRDRGPGAAAADHGLRPVRPVPQRLPRHRHHPLPRRRPGELGLRRDGVRRGRRRRDRPAGQRLPRLRQRRARLPALDRGRTRLVGGGRDRHRGPGALGVQRPGVGDVAAGAGGPPATADWRRGCPSPGRRGCRAWA